jgi:hypothetical protein
MSTPAQIIANRRNAQKSTGPQSPKGKAVVSRNAVKHGLTASQSIIEQEEQAEFDLYRQQFLEELAPQTPMESMLAERIVNLSWRLKRITRMQNQTIDALKNPKKSDPMIEKLKKQFNFGNFDDTQENQSPELALGRMAIKDFSNGRVLERLLMYERRLEHSLYKTLIELQRLNLIKNINSDTNPFKHVPGYDRAI